MNEIDRSTSLFSSLPPHNNHNTHSRSIQTTTTSSSHTLSTNSELTSPSDDRVYSRAMKELFESLDHNRIRDIALGVLVVAVGGAWLRRRFWLRYPTIDHLPPHARQPHSLTTLQFTVRCVADSRDDMVAGLEVQAHAAVRGYLGRRWRQLSRLPSSTTRSMALARTPEPTPALTFSL